MFALWQFDKDVVEENTWSSGFLEEAIFQLDLEGWVEAGSAQRRRGVPGRASVWIKEHDHVGAWCLHNGVLPEHRREVRSWRLIFLRHRNERNWGQPSKWFYVKEIVKSLYFFVCTVTTARETLTQEQPRSCTHPHTPPRPRGTEAKESPSDHAKITAAGSAA